MKTTKQVLAVGTALIPCTIESMNLRQYVKTSAVVRKKNFNTEDWRQLFEYLGAKKDELEDIELDEFGDKVFEFVKLMNSSKPTDLEIKEISTDKRTYAVELNDEGKIKIPMSLRKLTEKYVVGEEGNLYACALFYGDTQENKKTNQSEGTIKFRAELFAKMPAIDFIPFLANIMSRFTEVAEKIAQRVEQINEVGNEDEPAKEVTK